MRAAQGAAALPPDEFQELGSFDGRNHQRAELSPGAKAANLGEGVWMRI